MRTNHLLHLTERTFHCSQCAAKQRSNWASVLKSGLRHISFTPVSTGGVPGLALSMALLLMGAFPGMAQTTVSSDPADGATGVSPSAPVVFTFSNPMSTTFAFALFQSGTMSFFPVNNAWSANNTVLTCTPFSPFPDNTTINWTVTGMDVNSATVDATGSFTTGTGTAGGGSGTNATTMFTAGKLYLNEQTNSGPPGPFGQFGGAFGFTATTSLASNRTATAVTVKVPGASAAETLTQNFLRHEDYNVFDSATTATNLEARYPEGDYLFNVTGTPNNLSATVTLPTSMPQPNAPHVSNFDLAQSVDATQAFTVKWDAFQNATAADVVSLSVSDDHGNTLFATPNPGTNGALPGTTLSVSIPKGKLTANSTNTALLIFYHFVVTSNANYVTFAYRATGTQFEIITGGSAVVGPTPVVSNPVLSGNSIGVDVATAPNQALKVRFSTDCSLPLAQWQTILNTNSPGATVHLNIPKQPGAAGFIRIGNGP